MDSLTETRLLRAACPDTPAVELLDLSVPCPNEVLSNPALPLLALEDPRLWSSIYDTALLSIAETTIHRGIRGLGPAGLRLFACDCAERVLHLYEDVRPGDERPREAIATARAYALDRASESELRVATDSARNVIDAINSILNRSDRLYVARLAVCAAYCTTVSNAESRCGFATDEAARAIENAEHIVSESTSLTARRKEREWQAERMHQYLEDHW